MRWIPLIVLFAFAAPAPAEAVIFGGRQGWGEDNSIITINWSSDLGPKPPPAGFPAAPGIVSNNSYSTTLTGYTQGGQAGATYSLHLGPVGPLTLASPAFSLDMHTWGSCHGSGYGRFSAIYDQGNYYFEPAVMGESLCVLIHWQQVASGPPNSWSWSLSHGPVLLDQNSGSEGWTRTWLQGPDSRYYVLRLTSAAGGGISAGINDGDQDLVVHLDFYASDTPVTGVGPSTAGAPLQLSAPAPNPVREATTFALELPRRGTGHLEILDLSGRILRVTDLGSLDAGHHSLRWDRRDDRGTRVAAGVYWARVTLETGSPEAVAQQRVVVLD